MDRREVDWEPSPFAATVERRADGCTLLRPTAQIEPYPRLVTDRLEHWAAMTPDVTFVARRNADGVWQRVSYTQALDRIRRLAGGLVPLGLSPERPLMILSGNSIEHLLLGLAAMYAGVPYCPVSPAYSQANSDLSKLRYVVNLLTPGLVAAFGGGHFSRAIEAAVPAETLEHLRQLAWLTVNRTEFVSYKIGMRVDKPQMDMAPPPASVPATQLTVL